jgi:autotransporter-associated beta strand protein
MKPKTHLRLLISASVIMRLTSTSALAVPYYWDSNSTTAGFGTATGTWGSDAFWSTSSAGTVDTTSTTITTADIVNFGTATLNYGNANIDIAAGGVTATSIVFGAGQTTALTLGSTSGAAITLGGTTRTIVMNTSSTNTASHRINAPIILSGNTAIQVGAIGATATRTLTLGGQISGTGVVTFSYTGGNNGTGVILLNGANNYSGNTTISTTLTNANTQLRLGVENALPTSTILTLGGADGAGSAPGRKTELNLNGNDQTLAGLTNSGGGSLRTFNILSSAAATLTIDGTSSNTFTGLIGNGGTNISIVKDGSGTQTLSGANTYAGPTTINGGALRIQHASGLGATSGDTVVNGTGTANVANARLELAGSITVGAGESVTINGVGNFNGALTSATGNNIWLGGVTIGSAGTRIGATTSTSLEVRGVIDSGANPHGIIIRTANTTNSTVIFSGANTYLGNTQVLIGKLQLDGGDNRLPVGTNLVFSSSTSNGGAELDMNGRNQEVAGISISGGADVTLNGVNNNSATLSTLTVNTAASPSSHSGYLKGNLALEKTGSELLALEGINSYSGDTTVSDGTLRINGDHSGGGTYTVGVNGKLQGTGSTTSALNVSGVLSPGASVQTLASGTLNQLNGSTFEAELDSSVASSSGADLQIVSGDLNLSGAVTLTLGDLASSPVAFALGTTFSLINYSGAWNNGLFTFGGDEIADGGEFTAGLNRWQLDYNAADGGLNFDTEYLGGSDSFVNITAVVIPEPSAALLGGLGALLLLRRRRA